jgi:hypothetical protein
MMNGESVLVVATMKNEGLCVSEWPAHCLRPKGDRRLPLSNDLAGRIPDRPDPRVPSFHRANPKAQWVRYGRRRAMARDAGRQSWPRTEYGAASFSVIGDLAGS